MSTWFSNEIDKKRKTRVLNKLILLQEWSFNVNINSLSNVNSQFIMRMLIFQVNQPLTICNAKIRGRHNTFTDQQKGKIDHLHPVA